MSLTRIQCVLLDFIRRHSGSTHWYQLGRACLGRLDSPGDLELRSLLDAGLIRESPYGDEPPGRLWFTDEGIAALAAAGHSIVLRASDDPGVGHRPPGSE